MVIEKDTEVQVESKETTEGAEKNDQTNGEKTAEQVDTDDNKELETIQTNGGDAAGQEMILIQDTSFTIKIHAPGVDPFELGVSSMELVQEIQQVLYDKEETCHRTCFTLQLDGVVLDNFCELKAVEGLQEGSVIKVVEEAYTVREARIHVRHVRDLLKSVEPWDAYNGQNGMSLSFLNTITGGDILDKKRPKPDTLDCTPPEYVQPGAKERPIMALHPSNKDSKVPQCLKVLTYSGWNPPPGNRRMHGDLLYLFVVTMEDKKFHITASSRGYYINQSTDDVFNPKAAQTKHLNHSLVDLLSQISPLFKKNFSILLKKRSQKHPFERVPTPYQVYSWLAPVQEHNIDSIRAEDAFSAKLGYEEHIPGQTRDWNEELQTTRELPRKSLPERLIRERAIFKIHSDFVSAATRAAVAVIDGNIMAINPGESSKMQMFIWNNIFFSLGFDVKDHYKDFGGDAAAYVAPCNDLQGVKAYTGVDAEGVYTLGTVVVDYRGYRVTAQSIIPGILEREQEQSVVYGSIDFGRTVTSNEKYRELLEKTSSQLKIRPHRVVNDKGEEVLLLSSVECKGIVGNDNRHYVLDLLRTFPPDLNFLPVEGEELCNEVRELGFPVEHRHRIVCLRQELVEAFIEDRYMAFIRSAANQFQQMRLEALEKRANEEGEKASSNEETSNETAAAGDEASKASAAAAKEDLDQTVAKLAASNTEEGVEDAKKLVEEIMGPDSKTFEERSRDIVKKAAAEVGSVSDSSFDISFNPDVFQPRVKHADPDSEELKKDRRMVREAAEFLLLQQLPQMVKECREHQIAPMDGDTLSDNLHQRGINIRYLGKFTELVAKHPNLQYLQGIATLELISRAAKHLFQAYMQGVEQTSLAAAITHFLNCFLGSFPTPHVHVQQDDSRKSKKNRKKRSPGLANSEADSVSRPVPLTVESDTSSPEIEWASETPRTLWKKIVDEVSSYYHYRIEHDSLDSLVYEFSMSKTSLLRAFCRRCGVQILLREYALDSKSKQAVSEDDIINTFPIVKHIHPKATDAYHFFTSGQAKIQQGYLRDGHELISEALNLLNNVYGPIHPEIAACNKLLARLNYIMGDHVEAMAYEQRAVLISERVLGVDHPSTITEYTHLALYCFANGQVSNALRLLYRSRYLALLSCGENHPEVALIDSNIGLILHAVNEFELSLRFLEKALQLNVKFFGEKNLKVAISHHLVARAHSCRGDFRTALHHEKQAFNIYQETLGDDHERTKESAECLNHLTKQAVDLQKKMNDIAKGDKTVNFPPIQIQAPTMSNTLDTLNIINGILFVQLSPADIEALRAQMMDGKNGATATSETPSDEEAKTKSESAEGASDDKAPTVTSEGGDAATAAAR